MKMLQLLLLKHHGETFMVLTATKYTKLQGAGGLVCIGGVFFSNSKPTDLKDTNKNRGEQCFAFLLVVLFILATSDCNTKARKGMFFNSTRL